MKDQSELLEAAIRDALDALQDESTDAGNRIWEAVSILEEALDNDSGY